MQRWLLTYQRIRLETITRATCIQPDVDYALHHLRPLRRNATNIDPSHFCDKPGKRDATTNAILVKLVEGCRCSSCCSPRESPSWLSR